VPRTSFDTCNNNYYYNYYYYNYYYYNNPDSLAPLGRGRGKDGKGSDGIGRKKGGEEIRENGRQAGEDKEGGVG